MIREFQPGDEIAFRSLNQQWIERYFQMEPPDVEVLSDPQSAILDDGGRILFAVLEGRTVGCCALIRMDEGEFEVAKMAVAPECQGAGIGRALLTAGIDLARSLGAHRLFLETNHVLTPAIRLYESLGFQHMPPERIHPSPYARSDVKMELILSQSASSAEGPQG
jgi:GNAT superfamily N-acetyltransferase